MFSYLFCTSITQGGDILVGHIDNTIFLYEVKPYLTEKAPVQRG